ncbi:MAG: DNA polymerase III subunit delta' C-terminal domain-containing protein [Patescibacteria group bacterium]|jgi:DNA polymerase-3 subunit delta'
MKVNSYNLHWDICGQEKATSFLQSAIKNEMLSHAYLFYGPQGVGKYKLAQEFAKSIMCAGIDHDRPCGKCFSCKQMVRGSHLDFFLVERLADEKKGKLKKDIVIDQIRDLKSRLQQGTLLNSYKVAIIPEAQHLNGPSFSGLLKILEEPAQKNIIILITDDISKMPRTIISRSQTIKFGSVAHHKIEEYLVGKNINFDESKLLSKIACGRPGKALSLAHNSVAREKYFTSVNLFFDLWRANLSSRFNLIGDFVDFESDYESNKPSFDNLLENWQSVIRDILLCQNNATQLVSNFQSLEQIEKLGAIVASSKLENILSYIGQARKYLGQNINNKLIIENLIIKL